MGCVFIGRILKSLQSTGHRVRQGKCFGADENNQVWLAASSILRRSIFSISQLGFIKWTLCRSPQAERDVPSRACIVPAFERVGDAPSML